jgi:hypothetical protein
MKNKYLPLIMAVLLASLLALWPAGGPSAQVECIGQCEVNLERCLRGGVDIKSRFNP